jgi:hypothetical protein
MENSGTESAPWGDGPAHKKYMFTVLDSASRIGHLPFWLKWEVPFDRAGCPNMGPKSGSHFLIPKWEVVGQKREVVFEVSIMAPILRLKNKIHFYPN